MKALYEVKAFSVEPRSQVSTNEVAWLNDIAGSIRLDGKWRFCKSLFVPKETKYERTLRRRRGVCMFNLILGQNNLFSYGRLNCGFYGILNL
jgi:hypothetical protein